MRLFPASWIYSWLPGVKGPELNPTFPMISIWWPWGIDSTHRNVWASLVAQLVKNLPAMQETWVRSPSWEDPLEKGKATHSSILAWRIHGLYSPWGRKELDTTE